MKNNLFTLAFTVLLALSASAQKPVGASFSNPINIDTLTVGSRLSFTANNDPANGYGNDYTGTGNRSSDDIFYKFILSSTCDVTIDTNNSEVEDTYLHLLDGNGNLIAEDDDGYYSGTGYSRISRSLKAGTYYYVVESVGSYGGLTSNIAVTKFARDLRLYSLDLCKMDYSGYHYYASAFIYNSGVSNSGYINTKFYLSNNNTLSADDVLIHSNTSYDLEGNNCEIVDIHFNIPASFNGKPLYFIISIDPENAIFETNEANNVSATSFASLMGGSTTYTKSTSVNSIAGAETSGQEKESQLELFPNPCSEKLGIALSKSNDPSLICIYDMQGHLVKNETIAESSFAEINTSSLSNGLYIIKISNGGRQWSKKFMVEK